MSLQQALLELGAHLELMCVSAHKNVDVHASLQGSQTFQVPPGNDLMPMAQPHPEVPYFKDLQSPSF